MKTLNKNTKKAMGWLEAYTRAEGATVRTVYKRPSPRKMSIEDAILRNIKEEGGKDYRVISGNCSFFTCAYKVENKLVVLTGFDRYEITL